MKKSKAKRVIAIIALVFMVIASASIIMTLFNPDMWGGSIGYIALVSFLLGVGFFLAIKLMFKEPEKPSYLPPDGDGNERQNQNAAPDSTQQEKPREQEAAAEENSAEREKTDAPEK